MRITSEEQALQSVLEAVKTNNVVLLSNALHGYLEFNGIESKQIIVSEIRDKLITEDKVRDIAKINELELKNDLKDELATKKDLEKTEKNLEHKIDSLIFFLKMLVVLVIIFMTIFNPNVISFFKHLVSIL